MLICIYSSLQPFSVDGPRRLVIPNDIRRFRHPQPVRSQAFRLVDNGDSAAAAENFPVRVDLDIFAAARDLLALQSVKKLGETSSPVPNEIDRNRVSETFDLPKGLHSQRDHEAFVADFLRKFQGNVEVLLNVRICKGGISAKKEDLDCAVAKCGGYFSPPAVAGLKREHVSEN